VKHKAPKLKLSGHIFDTVTGFDFTKDQPIRPLRAIRLKCTECQGGNKDDIRDCTLTDCTLWPYRHGKRVEIDKTKAEGLRTRKPMTEEHKLKLQAARAKANHLKKVKNEKTTKK
jgi:hypothetical protein